MRDTKGISREKVNEFETIKEEIGNASKDLKGKKFVVDKEGRMQTVDPVRPESIPPFVVTLKSSVSDSSYEDVSLNVGVIKKKKIVRVAGSPALNETYFKAASTLATSLAGGGQIAVINPGVSIQSGDSMRSGEAFLSDLKRANRKEYLRIGTKMSTFNINDSLLETSSSSQIDSPKTVNDSNFESADQESNCTRLLSRVLDVDIFEGSRRLHNKEPEVAPEGESEKILYGELSTISVNSSSSSRRPGKASEKQKQNISLLSGGPAVAGYRDRDIPIGMLPPSERTKLPAPPIGYTMGHGLRTVANQLDRGMGASMSMSMSSINSKYDGLPHRTSKIDKRSSMVSVKADRQ